MPTSGARRTVAILRSLCQEVGLSPGKFIARLLDGFTRYGADNHLSPEFALRDEWDAEILDVVDFPAIAVSRGMVDRDDPLLAVYMRAARTMVNAQAAMLGRPALEAERDCWGDCLTCDVACEPSGDAG